MEKFMKLATYIAKVLLPVFLGSLLFSGIVAKYNNEMNLNKSILESAYQPMKEQFRKCMRERGNFHNSLNLYKASIMDLHERLQLILKSPHPNYGILTPYKQKVGENESEAGSEVERLWKNLLMSNEELGSLYGDLAIMLGVADSSDFNKILKKRDKRHDPLIHKSNEIFKELNSFKLEDIFMGVQKASAEDLRKNAPQWVESLGKSSKLLQKLSQLEEAEFKDQDDDYVKINGMTIKELKKRYQRDIFDYFIDLF